MPDHWDSHAGRTHFVSDGCVPAHRVADDDDGRTDALHVHGKLGEELETLRLLERKLKRRPDQDLHERVRADMVAVAIEHLESAIEALLMAGKE